MKKTVAVLFIAVLGVLSACAPSTERVLGTDSSTYILQRGLFDRQAEFIVKDADSGLNAYRVEPPIISLREALVIKDVQGPTLGRIVRKVLVLTPSFEIYRNDVLVATLGESTANMLSNALVGNSVGDRYTVFNEGGAPNLEIRGKVFDLNYDIYSGDVRVGHVSKAALSRNYFVEIAQGQDDVLILETVIALNELTAAQQAKRQ